MSSYVIPLFPAAAASPLPTRDAVAAELSRLRDRVDAGLPGKADKVPSASAGNLASLDASGNLADSGATPASIKAAAVAEVVANAPAALDTLEEIADILGSAEQTGTVLKRILDLESGKADSSSLAAVATSGSYDDLSGTPAIPAAVAVDAALATRGAAADAKAVGDALRGGFAPWEFSGDTQSGVVYTVVITIPEPGYYIYTLYSNESTLATTSYTTDDISTVVFNVGVDSTITATRHLITPTKTSQLTNDSGFLTSHQDISGKADKVSGATAGNLAALTAQGNLSDSGVKASDFAAKSDLPYRLVEPGKWEFSDGLNHSISGPSTYGSGRWIYLMDYDYSSNFFDSESAALSALSLTFEIFEQPTITATRASLPGRLCDRAGNRVVVTGDTTLTLPAAITGHLRDFLVRLEISGSTVPTITFAASTGETMVYETDGDEFPVPDEAGTWSYSFTENCVAHKFAVSLKKVNEVAAPTTQGGS